MSRTTSPPSGAVVSTKWLDRNLEALAARIPKIAAILRSAAPSPLPRAPEPPPAASRAVASVTPTPGPGGMGPPIFVLGAGSLERVPALLDERLGTASRQPVVVVEQNPGRLASSLAATDRRLLIADERVRWAIGPDPVAACRAAFDDDPCFWFLDASFVAGDPEVEAELAGRTPPAHWNRFVTDAGADLQRTLADLERLRTAFTEHRRTRPALADLATDEACIFSVTDANTSALRFIARDMLDAAARAGHPTTLHEENHLADPFRLHRRTRAFLEARPDLMLSLVQSGRQTFGALAEGLPVAAYYSSDPERYALDAAGFTALDHVFVADPEWTRAFARRGITAHVLPLGTSMHLATDTKAQAGPTGAVVSPLGARPRSAPLPPGEVGERSEPGEGKSPGAPDRALVDDVVNAAVIVANLTGPEHVLPDASPEVYAEVRRLGDLLVAEPADHPAAGADTLVAGSPLAPHEDATRRVARAVEVAATFIRRRAAAVILADAGVPLRIYGGDAWTEGLAGTPAAASYHGPLDYAHEVPVAYRHAAVVINVGSVNAPEALNMRAFDVPAAGGCLVTDRRPGLDRAFAADEEVAVYDRIEDLPGIVGSILNDRPRRDAVARAGRDRVLRDHTWDARWSTLFRACSASA